MNKNIFVRKDFEGVAYQVDNGEDKVNIYKEDGVYGVNWAGCGTQKVEDAEAYIELIQRAIEEAKKMNVK